MNDLQNNLNNFYFLGNNFRQWLIAIGIFFGIYIVMYIFKKFIVARLKSLSEKTATKADDVLIDAANMVSFPFYFTVGVYGASRYLSLPEMVKNIIQVATMVIATVYIALAVQKIAIYIVDLVWKQKREDLDISEGFSNFINTSIAVLVWTLAIVLLLQNLGYNVSALIGGLGIIGIAIAFALQNVLSDVFAYFTIYFDKPFKVGDFIIVGQDMGTVKSIGKKTTRITTLEGQELVMTNKELTESRINNYGRMSTRRVVFRVGVAYETPREKLVKAKEMMISIIQEQDKARIDRCNLANFGEYSLEFETVYYIDSPDYNTFMDIQEKVNFSIIEAFEKENIKQCYPTRTLYIKNG